ncbi:MAG: hypothetical protein HQK75_03960 [Candidatus Magnetomorum sp.]|nr:hypothetical protein [Candidatus Magnetomorum sp.]
MKTIRTQIICLMVLGFLVCNVSPAFAITENKPSAEEMLVDVFLVRPLGLMTTLLGTGFFFVSLPFSLMGGNTVDVFGELVAGPATFTFQRPVGELDY